MTQTSQQLAEQVFQAYKTHQPIPFLNPEENVDEVLGYQTQDALIAQLKEHHQTDVAGYKVSMTSAETQAYANTHEPAYGTLLKTVIKQSGATVKLGEMFAPLIEPELVFVVTEDLPSDPSVEDVLNHSQLAPAIEVPDARYEDWFPNFTLGDLLSDNTATGLVVVGEPVAQLDYDKLGAVTMSLKHNGSEVKTGVASEVLGNPVKAVQWLSQKLASHGKSLKKGDVISSGTFIPPIKAEKGTYTVDYKDVGQVTVTFE
ncbi:MULTISPECIES: fumarylacetoacetate hydrolase family protein [unclassified Staphylococcus]|uniref:2-keto-4-pentenoate hydratase n=1 Tax=unclassified Staphylococcus TaxID=91994 RepID=UPI0021CE17C3|nr:MULTISPECIES: fumarylacetoacetate hydrolase family protein [unclassified Staphylococcus]UXR71614.1 fumarylacetoacetate hydrolase family protein [Staphylococcus sp. IVB6240]UXR73888.1 fumarylacetoacetate hydrolase family protein [Staphylococcus sp. IVB6238]UXR76211.1 fumarylacetoacetate hydrolase family protein [Staphylococcus sp. IVB6233]UXR80408.1 fumarylacetoacetate hydrolase family protein [Staphylococcus sp. IVB6218]